MLRVLLVDDSPAFLKILEKILSSSFEVVGKASNGLEGFEMYTKLKPDLVLMDITMPHANGKECLSNIISLDPNAKVIMVTSIGDEATLNECISLGAKGFVSKDTISIKLPTEPLKEFISNVVGA